MFNNFCGYLISLIYSKSLTIPAIGTTPGFRLKLNEKFRGINYEIQKISL